jgi:hypothetical protein
MKAPRVHSTQKAPINGSFLYPKGEEREPEWRNVPKPRCKKVTFLNGDKGELEEKWQFSISR